MQYLLVNDFVFTAWYKNEMTKDPIQEAQDRRRKRLKELCNETGKQAEIAAKYGLTGCNPSYISNLINGVKPISEKVMINLEKAANKPRGWFDGDDDIIEGQVIRPELPAPNKRIAEPLACSVAADQG